ncbi:MAG: DNA polymerase III subunit epsilon [Cytophagales bacterium]|nr:MAG: DNA polymerase III subunit epsilon [Cytophagales bacterium]
MRYAVVDIETTGNFANEDRIIEIAIIICQNNTIIQHYQTLINPERFISPFITQLTGINNEMVQDAPKFYEVAKKIIELTQDCIFVAHNVHFDYTFIKREFAQLGYKYNRKLLCTLRLSRKLISGLPSYSLANVSKHLNINLTQHHRAQADAQAATEILIYLLEKNPQTTEKNIIQGEITAKALPPKIEPQTFEQLPEKTGVYYFKNEKNDIIYIGKSNNIKKRIASHFSTNLNDRKTIEFKNHIAQIDYLLTGSELIALLLESDEIKKHKPIFNKAQRRSQYAFGIFQYTDEKGYIRFIADNLSKRNEIPLYIAGNLQFARKMLASKVKEYQLCQKLCHLYDQHMPTCFDYQVKQCYGACTEEESPESYNQRANEMMLSFQTLRQKSFIIITQGRNRQENGLVIIDKGIYQGFGYLSPETDSFSSIEEAYQYIKPYQHTKDTQKIILQWLKKYPQQKIITH